MRALQLCSACTLLGAVACSGPQSAFVTAGRDAEQIGELFTVMTVGAVLVWVAVVGIAVYTLHVGESHSQRAADLLILGGGVAAPTIVLAALLAYGMPVVPRVLALPEQGLTIRVTAKQWWWRFEYMAPSGPIETANELRLPLGERVTLRLESPDVIHSFWVPSLAGKMDMIPGRITQLALEPTRTGTFRGVCAEYCGASHALMAFSVTVMEPEAFQTWLTGQARDAAAPADPTLERGRAAFIANGCTACHTIRGTAAVGRIGPDLTHVGARRRLAAETLPNDPQALARWITTTDRIKPGAHMPAFRALDAGDLASLTAYLSSLK